MRSGIVGSLLTLLASTGLALAQLAPPTRPAATPPPTPVAPPPAGHPEGPPEEVIEAPQPGTPLWSDEAPKSFPDDNSTLKQCRPCGFVWFSVEELIWWARGIPAPPLVTTGPSNVPPEQFGVLGVPGTRPLFGGRDLDLGSMNGARISGGVQGPDHLVGIEGGAFLFERRSTGFHRQSDAAGNPIIARPFTDVLNAQNSRLLTSGPGAFTGSLTAEASSRLFGAEANVTKAVYGLLDECGEKSLEIDWLAGFCYMDLNERLAFGQRSTILPGGFSGFAGALELSPTEIDVFDSINARNQFYGPQVGGTLEYQYRRLYLYMIGKVALGDVHQTLTFNGTTTAIPAGGAAQTVPGGLTALPTNIGQRRHDDFAAIPQVNINFGYQFTRNIRAYFGYTFIYWSEVSRPGDQASTALNVTQLPTSPAFAPLVGPAVPTATFVRSNYWAHGINIGLAYHF